MPQEGPIRQRSAPSMLRVAMWDLSRSRSGMAWHYKAYQHEQPTQERLVYRDEEEAAKAAKQGLWKDPKAMPTWAWRKSST